MKDIDFDELDRAVSSVLGQDKPVQAETSSEKVVVSSSTEKTSNNLAAETVTAVSANAIKINPRPKTTSTRPSGPSLATARRGKFMDFTHQSVQTQVPKPKPITEPAFVPKRGMVNIEPSKELIESSEKAKEESSEEAIKPVETNPTVEHVAEPTAVLDESNALIGAEPAPVTADSPETTPVPDNEQSTKSKDHTEQPEATDGEEPQHEKSSKIEDDLKEISLEDTPTANSSLVSSVPQESPFLADTKVQKRPLGGSSEEVEEDDLADYGFGSPKANDAQSAPVVPGPRELEDDIVRVEATQNEQEQSEPSSPFATNVAASAEPSDDGRVDGHPLFDTATYHEPIAAAHSSGMPGWAKWLIGLMLCLAVGAGVGYFLFTAGL